MINLDATEYDWPKRTSDRLADLTRTDLGGPGSGNFGHAGRPGEVGGSAPDGEGGDDEDIEATLARHEARRTLTDEERPRPGEADELRDHFQAHVQKTVDPNASMKGQPGDNYDEDIRSEVKANINEGLTLALRDHPAFKGKSEDYVASFVREKVDLWANTSGDHKPEAIQMQTAVKDEFDIHAGTMNHLLQTPSVAKAIGKGQEWAQMVTPQAQAHAQARAFVRAEYERTQRWFAKRGLTHVTLTRGMESDTLEAGTTETVQMQPASSWSANIATAVQFSRGGGQFATHKEGNPIVLVARVPVARILSTAVTGRGALSEEEVIVLGGEQKAKILSGHSRSRSESGLDPEEEFHALRTDRRKPMVNIDAEVSNADWIKRATKKHLSAVVNLPDISDVSFPEIIGAIAPTVPKRKKRKRAVYKGISLSRRPMKFEAQVLSLTEIPKRLDLARDGLVAKADDDALLQETMQDIASYGAREVLVELTRQGAPAQLVDRPVSVDVDGIYAGLLTDRARALTLLREDYEARLGRRRIGAERKAALTREFTDVRRPALLKRFANRAVNEAFAYGRAQAIQALRRSRMPTEYELAYRDEQGRFISTVEAIAGGEAIVDAVIQTAVMDTGTCDECAEVDGEQMELGSDRQEELRPPYVKCAGGDHCRCVQIALLADGTEVDVSDVDEDTIE